jgi:uncharacterized membrane protein
MTILIVGLLIFLGIHSSRIFAETARQNFIAQRGENAWKGIYTVVSFIGLGLIVWGYGLARQQPIVLWNPPAATRHIAALLTLIAFILVASTYFKQSWMRVRFQHPMVLGVKVWALSHLLSNGTLADVLLFGGFLAWAVLCFIASKKRDRLLKTQYPAAQAKATILAVVAGVIGWLVMAMWLHGLLIGVKPFG